MAILKIKIKHYGDNDEADKLFFGERKLGAEIMKTISKNHKGILYVFLSWVGCLLFNLVTNITLMEKTNLDEYNNYFTVIGTAFFLIFWLSIILNNTKNIKLLKCMAGLSVLGILLAILCLLNISPIIELLNWPYMIAMIGLENFFTQTVYFKIQIVIFSVYSSITMVLLIKSSSCNIRKIISKLVNMKDKIIEKHISLGSSRKDIMLCPLAFAEIGVKGRVNSVLKYKKPAFWIIVVGLIACAAVSVFFLTSPKDDGENDVKYYAVGQNNKILYDEFESVYKTELLKYEDYNKAMKSAQNTLIGDDEYTIVNPYFMSEITCFTGAEIYFCDPYSSYSPLGERYTIKQGLLYKYHSNFLIGLLMPVELTKANFENLILYHLVAMQMFDEEDSFLYTDTQAVLESIRNSCKNAWIADGEYGTCLLLEVEDEVFYAASCHLDEQGNIESYDYLIRLEKDVVGELDQMEVVTETESPEVLEIQSMYGSHYGECVHGYFGDIEFISSSVRRFPNGDERLYIEPQKADDEHYFVYRHLEDDSGYTDVYEYKLPTVREPLDSIPEITIECQKDSTTEVIDDYEAFINNWLGEDNGRTKDLLDKLGFNEDNTPLFKVPDWTTYSAGKFILKFPDGQVPDVVDVEDMVLSEDGSIRYEGEPNEVVFRGASIDRMNDTVDFSLADHSSISYYERATTGGSPKEPFYRGYRVRCYWGTTEGLQSVTYMFVIRTQNVD